MDKKSKQYVFRSKYIDEGYSKNGRKRDSNFYRRHLAKKKIAYIQFLARNIDQLVIVSSIMDPCIRLYFIDRLLVFSHYYDIRPIILLTKIDKEAGGNGQSFTSDEAANLYNKIGYKVYCLSNTENVPVDLMRNLFRNRKTSVVGLSGVGKTSLLNQMDEGYRQKIQEVSVFNGRGKHTTSKIRMHEFNFGGVVYDMPGLKSIDFATLSKRELSKCFVEFSKYLGLCQFRDCFHDKEDECSVKKAVEDGEIAFSRYQTYLEILEELPII